MIQNPEKLAYILYMINAMLEWFHHNAVSILIGRISSILLLDYNLHICKKTITTLFTLNTKIAMCTHRNARPITYEQKLRCIHRENLMLDPSHASSRSSSIWTFSRIMSIFKSSYIRNIINSKSTFGQPGESYHYLHIFTIYEIFN